MAFSENPPSFNVPDDLKDIELPPEVSDGVLGYAAENYIFGGRNNRIANSRTCSVINGTSNLISGLYNTHVIGNFLTPSQSNSFHVGCYNGLHVYGDVVAFTSSDERLKDDITLIENPLSKVLSLDAVEFNWNDNQEVYSGHDIGLIAQQVEEVAPEIVTTRDNGFKAVKYDRVTSLLVGAIKEQQKIIESLEERISKLENQTQ